MRADSSTDPSIRWASALAASGARSALFTTTSSGTSAAPISSSTVRTAAIWPSACSAVPSTTWTSRSASRTEANVVRNASTSWWGSLRTKPTVSVTSTVSPPGRANCRVRGSKVTKRRFAAGTPASVSLLRRVDLPALVYPTRARLTVSATGPAAALQRARPVDLAQVGLEAVHPPHQTPSVYLELGLAGAAGTDPTGLLAQAASPPPQRGRR